MASFNQRGSLPGTGAGSNNSGSQNRDSEGGTSSLKSRSLKENAPRTLPAAPDFSDTSSMSVTSHILKVDVDDSAEYLSDGSSSPQRDTEGMA